MLVVEAHPFLIRSFRLMKKHSLRSRVALSWPDGHTHHDRDIDMSRAIAQSTHNTRRPQTLTLDTMASWVIIKKHIECDTHNSHMDRVFYIDVRPISLRHGPLRLLMFAQSLCPSAEWTTLCFSVLFVNGLMCLRGDFV